MRLSPSTAPANKKRVAAFLRRHKLNTTPLTPSPPVVSAVGAGDAWRFKFAWKTPKPSSSTEGDSGPAVTSEANTDANMPQKVVRQCASIRSGNRALEETSYSSIVGFLKQIGAVAYNVANGQRLPRGLLYERHFCALRKNVPSSTLQKTPAGREVTKRRSRRLEAHTVAGRTDIVVLDRDYIREGHPRIEMWMVKILIEVKTETNMKKSKQSCWAEGVMQLVGATASHPHRSPPVIVTNLVGTHYVLYLQQTKDGMRIVDQQCASFPAAVRFALKRADHDSVASTFPLPQVITHTNDGGDSG